MLLSINLLIMYISFLKEVLTMKAFDLQKQYLEWYKAKSSFKNLNSKTVRIDVPFLDNFSDEVTMYAIENSNNTITLTDDGWTIDNLESLGVYISKSVNRKRIFNQKLMTFGIKNENDELTITVPLSKFPDAKNRLLQAMLSVNDMFMLSKNNTKSLFIEDVGNFLEENQIRATTDVSFSGASGMTFNFDFLISGYKKIPTRLIKTLSSPNNSMFAKVALTDILQTREIRQNSEYYVFLNDTNKENTKTPKIIRPEIQQMFKENNITTVLYSKRKEVLDQLKA